MRETGLQPDSEVARYSVRPQKRGKASAILRGVRMQSTIAPLMRGETDCNLKDSVHRVSPGR